MRRRGTPAEVLWTGAGVGLLESHHRADFRMDWRADPFDKLLFVLHGQTSLAREDGERQTLHAAALAPVPRGERHRLVDVPGRPASLFALCFDPAAFPFASLARRACGARGALGGFPEEARTRSRLRRMRYEATAGDAGAAPLIASLAAQSLVALLRSDDASSARQLSARERVRAYSRDLEHAFFEAESLDAAARRAGLGRRRFSDLFREINGTSWARRRADLQIGHARRLLASSDQPIKSVAFACGFDDVTAFYRAFKSRAGIAPKQYRERRRNAATPLGDGEPSPGDA